MLRRKRQLQRIGGDGFEMRRFVASELEHRGCEIGADDATEKPLAFSQLGGQIERAGAEIGRVVRMGTTANTRSCVKSSRMVATAA